VPLHHVDEAKFAPPDAAAAATEANARTVERTGTFTLSKMQEWLGAKINMHNVKCAAAAASLAAKAKISSMKEGLYKVNACDPWLESAWFQPLIEPIK
jgi:hypothetical protein